MIHMKSDYSPSVAPEKQEDENIKMVYAALHCAGLTCERLENYINVSQDTADRFNEALGEPKGLNDAKEPVHTKEQWDAATEAAKQPLALAAKILADAGITIENKLIKSEVDGYFHHIATKVYAGATDMELISNIERPIIDLEAETYADNTLGWGAENG